MKRREQMVTMSSPGHRVCGYARVRCAVAPAISLAALQKRASLEPHRCTTAMNTTVATPAAISRRKSWSVPAASRALSSMCDRKPQEDSDCLYRQLSAAAFPYATIKAITAHSTCRVAFEIASLPLTLRSGWRTRVRCPSLFFVLAVLATAPGASAPLSLSARRQLVATEQRSRRLRRRR